MGILASMSGHPHLDQWNDLLNEVAPPFGISPNLVKAHMEYESDGDPSILGTSGRGCGLMQIDYGTYLENGQWWYASVHGKTDQIFDPRINILIACRDFLVPLRDAFPNDLAARIVGYNAGIGAVQTAIDNGTALTAVSFAPWYLPSVRGAYETFAKNGVA